MRGRIAGGKFHRGFRQGEEQGIAKGTVFVRHENGQNRAMAEIAQFREHIVCQLLGFFRDFLTNRKLADGAVPVSVVQGQLM